MTRRDGSWRRFVRWRKRHLDLTVGTHRGWWFRPASKLSTVIAYVLIAISLVLHLF